MRRKKSYIESRFRGLRHHLLGLVVPVALLYLHITFKYRFTMYTIISTGIKSDID